MKYPEVRNYVAGDFVKGEYEYLDVFNPADGSVISKVPLSSRDELDRAVAVAQAAFPAARLHWFEHCGHFPHWDQPDDTVRVILETVGGDAA